MIPHVSVKEVWRFNVLPVYRGVALGIEVEAASVSVWAGRHILHWARIPVYACSCGAVFDYSDELDGHLARAHGGVYSMEMSRA